MKTPDHRIALRVILAPLIVIGFFGVIGAMMWMMYSGKIVTLNEGVKILMVALIGALTRDFGTIVSFCFGSSLGSEKKTEIMNAAKPAE